MSFQATEKKTTSLKLQGSELHVPSPRGSTCSWLVSWRITDFGDVNNLAVRTSSPGFGRSEPRAISCHYSCKIEAPQGHASNDLTTICGLGIMLIHLGISDTINLTSTDVRNNRGQSRQHRESFQWGAPPASNAKGSKRHRSVPTTDLSQQRRLQNTLKNLSSSGAIKLRCHPLAILDVPLPLKVVWWLLSLVAGDADMHIIL